ncbi:acyltransferase family protein [Rubricoccus marinus]|uniref:Acyltransferase 3 domain-containing protein n=1 Tax=Rubricoccus marinus TaxID=716817 RepID=A0A259TY79_9BACT|nr:acyltransferase [Rubricoccus marinus]OZC02577.1 hypothetical protein BSZ36_06045 [Rubricoccus marinus]
MSRIPNLDPVRFLLAALVVVFHVPDISATVGMPSWSGLSVLNRGEEAVYGFFVLSGFLITYLLIKEKAKHGTVSIRQFYIRRALRIWPVYFLVLGFGLLYYNVILPMVGMPFEVEYSIGEALAYNVLFLPNIFAYSYDTGGILVVLWSIGIEEQFYILWGPLSKYLPSQLFAPFLAAFFVVFGAVFWFSPLAAVLLKYKMFFYYFAAGGLFGTWAARGQGDFSHAVFSKPVQALALGLAMLYYTTGVLQAALAPWALHLADAWLFSYLVFNFGFNPNKLFTLRSEALDYLGQISYGIYMYHMIALNFVLFVFLQFRLDEVFGFAGSILVINGLTMALAIFGASLSYRYFESFFIRLKGRYRVLQPTPRVSPSGFAGPVAPEAGA